jgi:hypothetical protein
MEERGNAEMNTLSPKHFQQLLCGAMAGHWGRCPHVHCDSRCPSLAVLATGRGHATHSPDVDAATEDAAWSELPAHPPPWPLEAEEEDLPKMQDIVGDAYCANGYA